MDKGTALGQNGQPQNDQDNVRFWADKSGNNYHANANGYWPKYTLNAINGLPAINTQGDRFTH